jgi:hypothetical protein
MKIVQISKVYSIKIKNTEILTSASKRILLSLSWGGGLFDFASAQITIFEPIPALTTISDYGGLWTISVDGNQVFQGFAETPKKERAMGGNIFTFNLRSILYAWDVLLTNKSFGATGSGASVILDPDNMTTYLQYLVNTVGAESGIHFAGTLPQNSMPFSELYENGVLSVTNSTYLSEIQRACQALGYIVFADPAGDTGVGAIRIIDALNSPPAVVLTSAGHYLDSLNASFSVSIASIPATVLVADDVNQQGVAYGFKNSGADYDRTNFDKTRLNNIAFATTVGIDKAKLPGIAQQIYDISRKASQILTFRIACLLTDNQALGYSASWVDSMGNLGLYTIQKYTSSITPQELYSEIEAYVK